MVLQIGGVDHIDNVSARESWIGLTFVYDNKQHMEELENTKLEKQLVGLYEKG